MAVTSFGTPAMTRATSGSVTGTWGTGQNRTAGHQLVAAVTAGGTTATAAALSTPAGWTQAGVISNTPTTANAWVAFYVKTAAGSDSAPAFTATLTGTVAMTCTLFEFAAANDAIPVDGVDAWPYISGANSTPPRSRIVHAHDMYSGEAVGAIRDGDFKLVVETVGQALWYGNDTLGHFTPPQNGSAPDASACSIAAPCLFDVAADPRETTDLAPAMPAKVAELLALFHSYDGEHHPPRAAPPNNKAACCAAGKKAGGYLVPWGS